MRELDPTGEYTDAEVRAALAFTGGRRQMSYRFDRLSHANEFIEPLAAVLSASVSNNALADIKRTAQFSIRDDGSLDYLKDRIKPYARLEMPSAGKVWRPADLPDAINALPHPRPRSATWNTGNGSVITVSYPPMGKRTLMRAVRVSTAAAAIRIGFQYTPLTAGDIVVGKVRARVVNGPEGGRAATLALRLGTSTASLTAAAVTLTSDWQEFALDPFTVATTAGNYSLALVTTTGAVGETYELERAGCLIGTDVLFDALDTDAKIGPGYVYDWEGAETDSRSLRRPLLQVEDDRRGYVEWPLGVFLLSTPKRKYLADGGYTVRDVEAYDQLQVLTDDKVVTRYTAAQGALYTTVLTALAAAVGVAVRITPSALALPAAREWDPGTSYRTIINDLLEAMNYESAWFDEDGTLICRPYQAPSVRPEEWEYATDARSVIGGDIDQTLDLFGVPNRIVLVKSEPDQPPLSSTYTNVSPTSPTSTVSRGRTIVEFQTEQDAADQATLDALAERRMFEVSQVYEVVEFTTAAMPFHSNADVYRLAIPEVDVSAKYSEHEWSLALEPGALMSHRARRVVNV